MSKKCKFDLPKEQDAEDVLLSYKQGIKTGRAEALAEVNEILDKWYMRLWKMSKNPSANYFDDLKLEIKSLVESKE